MIALTSDNNLKIQLTQSNLTEFYHEYCDPPSIFVKNDIAYSVYKIKLGVWIWKDETRATKDRGNAGDYLLLGAQQQVGTTPPPESLPIYAGGLKLLTQAQLDARGFVKVVYPDSTNQYVFN